MIIKGILLSSSKTNLFVEAKDKSTSQIVRKKKKMERLHFYLFAILQREDFPTSVLGGGPKMIIEKQKLVKGMERLCSK